MNDSSMPEDWNIRGYKKGRQSRDKILKKAMHLFAKQGYDTTSLDQIALACKVTKGAIYAHFKNKRELYKSCVLTCFIELGQGHTPTSSDPLQALREYITWFAHLLAENPEIREFQMQLMKSKDKRLRNTVVKNIFGTPYAQLKSHISGVNKNIDAHAYTFITHSILFMDADIHDIFDILDPEDHSKHCTEVTVERVMNIITNAPRANA